MDPEDRQLLNDLLDATSAHGRRGGGTLHRLREPQIKSLAIVPVPANGNRWCLFKSQPESESDAQAEAMLASLAKAAGERVDPLAKIAAAIERGHPRDRAAELLESLAAHDRPRSPAGPMLS